MPKVSKSPRRKVVDVEKVHAEAEKEQPTGPEIMEAMGENPTLDKVFDTSPDKLTNEELWNYIDGERQRHAQFIEKESE